MRYIKKFEDINEPDIGDYVLLNDDYGDDLFDEFIMTNIGQIIGFQMGWNTDKIIYKKSEIHLGSNDTLYYIVEYEDIPEEVMNIAYVYLGKTIGEDYCSNILTVQRHQISAYSSNREDLEIVLQAKKYNL